MWSHLKELSRQVISIINAPIHGDKLLDGLLVLNSRVVERGIQHNDGKWEDKAGVWVLEDWRVEFTVAVGKALHHPVNLLCLSWQAKAPQELSVGFENM